MHSPILLLTNIVMHFRKARLQSFCVSEKGREREMKAIQLENRSWRQGYCRDVARFVYVPAITTNTSLMCLSHIKIYMYSGACEEVRTVGSWQWRRWWLCARRKNVFMEHRSIIAGELWWRPKLIFD